MVYCSSIPLGRSTGRQGLLKGPTLRNGRLVQAMPRASKREQQVPTQNSRTLGQCRQEDPASSPNPTVPHRSHPGLRCQHCLEEEVPLWDKVLQYSHRTAYPQSSGTQWPSVHTSDCTACTDEKKWLVLSYPKTETRSHLPVFCLLIQKRTHGPLRLT